MLHDVLTGRPFREFEPGAEESEVARRVYGRGVAFTRRFLASVDAQLPAVLAAEVLVAAHGGLLHVERAGTLARSHDRKY